MRIELLLKRDENIRRRVVTFESNLHRAVDLRDLSVGAFAQGPPSDRAIVSDLERSAIVFAVGSVDELCKGLFFEVISGYLLGDLELPNSPRASIPSGVARLFLDGVTSSPMVRPQFEALAVGRLQAFVERDNFQSYEQIAARFAECGLGRLRDAFPVTTTLDSFRQSLVTLANIRHSAVHRVGLIDQNSQISNDDHLVSDAMSRFSVHVENLRVGGAALAQRVLECVESKP